MKGSIRTRRLTDGQRVYDVLYRAEGKQRGRTFPRKKDAEATAPKPVVPVFGRRVKRYSNRL